MTSVNLMRTSCTGIRLGPSLSIFSSPGGGCALVHVPQSSLGKAKKKVVKFHNFGPDPEINKIKSCENVNILG